MEQIRPLKFSAFNDSTFVCNLSSRSLSTTYNYRGKSTESNISNWDAMIFRNLPVSHSLTDRTLKVESPGRQIRPISAQYSPFSQSFFGDLTLRKMRQVYNWAFQVALSRLLYETSLSVLDARYVIFSI